MGINRRSLFLSTPSARRATAWVRGVPHAGDHFYPRPPRGGRHQCEAGAPHPDRFLSTPSARRATRSSCWLTAGVSYFYPRPPRGGRPAFLRQHRPPKAISIHALREEGDVKKFQIERKHKIFLSTPSARRATSKIVILSKWSTNFYPRPPRGGRQESVEVPDISKIFLSTPSARRATSSRDFLYSSMSISIHALREEGDLDEHDTTVIQQISIHALREEGDPVWLPHAVQLPIFLSTPSARRATAGK